MAFASLINTRTS